MKNEHGERMTTKQFSSYLRFLLDDLIDIKEEKNPDRQSERLDKLIDIVKKHWSKANGRKNGWKTSCKAH